MSRKVIYDSIERSNCTGCFPYTVSLFQVMAQYYMILYRYKMCVFGDHPGSLLRHMLVTCTCVSLIMYGFWEIIQVVLVGSLSKNRLGFELNAVTYEI